MSHFTITVELSRCFVLYMLRRIIVGINAGSIKKVYDLTVSLCFGGGG